MESYHTIPEMLLGRAALHANHRAVNDRMGDEWRNMAMPDLLLQVSSLSAALEERFPDAGTCVGILAAPSARWLVTDMAVMLAGHVAVPFFTDFSEAHFLHKIEDAGIKTIFVFGASIWQRFRPFVDRFALVITDQTVSEIPGILHIDELITQGSLRMAAEPGLVDRLRQRVKPDDLAVIIYTSGSTGAPKGVELTHRNLTAQLHDIEPLFPIKACKDRALSLLPVAHSFERIVIYLYLVRGMSIYFVDDIDNLGVMFREVRPTMMTVVPRLLERTYERIAEKSNLVFGLMGGLARWSWKHASRKEGCGGFVLANLLSDLLVGWQIRKSMGGQLRVMVVGGAHMPDELNRFFVRMGVPLYEGYGLTEAAPVISVNYPGSRKLGSVGRPLANVQVKLTDEGELLARGPNIMRGYRNLPEETARVIDGEDWLHTGDMASLDEDGYLSIVARKKEMFKTSTGEIVFPLPIEQALCQSDLVEMACVVAEARKFTSVLLFLNRAAVSRMKQRCGAASETDAAFANSFAMHQEVQSMIRQVNARLDHWEKIQIYALLLEAPTVGNGLLTPTLKIRRHKVEERYRTLIDRVYDESKKMEGSDEFAIGHS